MTSDAPSALVEHFFRHESGRLAAVLTRRFGASRIEEIEDAIQVALERALGTWTRRGLPENPAAWLTRVATNHLLDQVRRAKTASDHAGLAAEPLSHDLHDADEDSLVLLFACADERLAPRARLVLCLKLLSGFSTDEIAARLFMQPATVQKTLERGRARLKEIWHDHGSLPATSEGDSARLQTVQLVLYLQFNEGYSFGHGDESLRVELCDEAIRLTRLLATHAAGNVPSTWALLSLMHFHASRLPARLDAQGGMIPLEEQNRELWDQRQIRLGFEALRLAYGGGGASSFSRFHGEAAIQVEHAGAPSFQQTRWGEIVELYELLERLQPSPVYALNRSIALAEAQGAERALAVMEAYDFPSWFQENHLFQAARGELFRRLGQVEPARRHFEVALARAPSRPERRLLERRLKELEPGARQ